MESPRSTYGDPNTQRPQGQVGALYHLIPSRPLKSFSVDSGTSRGDWSPVSPGQGAGLTGRVTMQFHPRDPPSLPPGPPGEDLYILVHVSGNGKI